MVIEKAWAKLHLSYNAIDGGLPNEVLHAFSGAPTKNYLVRNYMDNLDALFQIILEAEQKEHIICCGTSPEDCKKSLEQVGLVGGHAYTVLGVYDQPYKMLKIRNPWGSLEWKRAGSDSD